MKEFFQRLHAGTNNSSSSAAPAAQMENPSSSTSAEPMEEDQQASQGSIDTETEEKLLESEPETTKGQNEKVPSNSSEEKKKNLSGAMKKRIRWHRKQGLSYKAALEKAKEPMPTIQEQENQNNPKDKGNKRNRSDTSITPQTEKKSKTTSGHQAITRPTGPLKFSEVLKSVKVGIVPAQYPEKKLSEEEVMKIRKDVLKLIFEQRAGNIKPKFTQLATAKSGWLLFHCSNEETANWLKSQSYWTDMECVAIDEKQFPAEHILTGYFKYSSEDTTAFILGMVEGQNEGLHTQNWREINRKDEGHLAIITVEVDEASMISLRKTDLLIDYAYGKVKLKLKSKRQEVETGPEELCRASTSTPSATTGAAMDTNRPKLTPARKGTSKNNKDAPSGVPSTPVTRLSERLKKVVEVPKTPSGPNNHTKPM